MRRISWPLGLHPAQITPLGGPRSLGMTESVTGAVQTVSQPYGLLRFQFDFPPLTPRMAAQLEGLLAALEDGANWVGVEIYPQSPDFDDMGLSDESQPWSNGQQWSNGENWAASLPLASAASAGAIGDRTISIDVSAWNGAFWPGAKFGALHFGAYIPQEVDIVGDIATVRFWPTLRKEIAAGEIITLNPVVATRLQPGSWSAGTRNRVITDGASITLIEVPDDVVRAYTE